MIHLEEFPKKDLSCVILSNGVWKGKKFMSMSDKVGRCVKCGRFCSKCRFIMTLNGCRFYCPICSSESGLFESPTDGETTIIRKCD